ncbi:MAG TPA: lipid-binding SYLF domain-containing protein [Gemmataceae bacterium]|jgi:lipid-binding SYLF domain-containing protein|nr:lipid-binding SYLF domain-containing protein [Gemmataceae bacterium]
MTRRFPMFVLSLLTALPAAVNAEPREPATVEDAIEVLKDFATAPEKRIPPKLLQDASAVIVAPDVVKGGFIVGARHGHGVLLVRQKGGWSDPIFVTLTGGSVGFQAGVSATDLFLVIRNARSLERILQGGGKLALGADASVAAGPIGREASAATDAQLKAEILAYSRSRGLFGGVALDGDTIMVDHSANDRYYGKRKVTVADIVGGKVDSPKDSAILRARLGDWSGETLLPPPASSGPTIRLDTPKKQ